MNRYFAIGCLGVGLMVSPLLGRATSAVPGNTKIAVINMEETLSTTPAGKRANESFEKTRKGKQAELDKQQDELKKADADLQKQQAVLKPDVFESKRKELEKKFVTLQQTYVKLERELADGRTKLIQELFQQAAPKIKKIAQDEGVTIVIDRSGEVVYFDPNADLTQKLNAEMK
jgi:outer membrane protein